MTEPFCIVCGHKETVHLTAEEGITIIEEYGKHWCEHCISPSPARSSFHTFAPDNLSYIEQLAKEKGLV